jgi:hypothetical protein
VGARTCVPEADGRMILLDSTVPCYAVGEGHSLRERCPRVSIVPGQGRAEITTTYVAPLQDRTTSRTW